MTQQRGYPWMFLPDTHEDPVPAEGTGIVRAASSPSKWLADLAGNMLTYGETPAYAAPDVLNIDARACRAIAQQTPDEAVWRGMLALMLLWDAWEHPAGGPKLDFVTIGGDAGEFSDAVLNAMTGKNRRLTLVTLEDWEHGKTPLCAVSGRALVAPAADLSALEGMLPARVTWYDSERRTLIDPTDNLSTHDATLLQGMLMQLTMRAREKEHTALATALGSFVQSLEESKNRRAARASRMSPREAAMMETHLLAATGLAMEPYFPMLTVEQQGYSHARNRMLNILGAEQIPAPDAQKTVWLWRGVPFMRSDEALGLERIPGAASGAAVAEMTEEINRLLCHAPAWCVRTARRMEAWINDASNPCATEALRGVASALAARLTQVASMHGGDVTLAWPWPADSGAVRLLTSETVGEKWADAVLKPFSDCLTLVERDAVATLGVGTLQLNGDGSVAGDMAYFCAVPPVSRAMAESLCACLHEDVTLAPDGMKFLCHADEAGEACVTAQYALSGGKRLVLTRTYAADEIVSLEEDETPTVAVWPSIPMNHYGWRSYYVYSGSQGRVRVEALDGGVWREGEMRQASDETDVSWYVQHTGMFPACLMLRMDGKDIGMLPNLLPEFRAPSRPHATIALDLGASGTAVAITQGADTRPLQVSSTRRVLLTGADAARPDFAFVDGDAVQPVFSGAVETFADASDLWQRPVMDAHIATQSPFSKGAQANASRVHWGLKWSYAAHSDELKKRYLASLMQTAVHTAVTMGSESVAWRVSMPADMAGEGKRRLLKIVQELAGETAELTGIPLADGVPAVSWADESVAAGYYFRKMSRTPVHGGFTLLDIGGGSSKLMLWLRGMPQPNFMLSIPLGAQHMLLEALMVNPSFLAEDFSGAGNEALLDRMKQLAEQFTRAQTDVNALELARYMLDELLAHDLKTMHQYMNSMYTQGTCSRTQALLLLQVSFLLMLTGVMLEQVYCDSTLNDYLPPFMEICLAGRGTQLMYGFNNGLQRRLSSFVRTPMSREHPTREMAFVPSDAMKLEAAMGLARLPETETHAPGDYIPQDRRGAQWINPVAIIRRFLWQFRMELPLAAMKLFPNDYDGNGGLTPAADARLMSCAEQCFSGQGKSIEQNCTAWLSTLLRWMA